MNEQKQKNNFKLTKKNHEEEDPPYNKARA